MKNATIKFLLPNAFPRKPDQKQVFNTKKFKASTYRARPRHSERPTKAHFPPPVRIFMAVAAKWA